MLPYIAEFLGTMILILLGDGVVANVSPFMTLSCFILCPISTFTSHIASM